MIRLFRKTEPIQFKYGKTTEWVCGLCKNQVYRNYCNCPTCGARLKWGD